MSTPLLLLAAALLPAAAAVSGVPAAALCSDGECAVDSSVNLLQASAEARSADVLTKHGANARTQDSNATRPLAQKAPEVEMLQPNASFMDLISQEIQIELDFSDAHSIPTKNKVLLTIIEFFGLGLCGIDRCYVGQTALGVVKGLTLGGFVVWAFLDYLVVAITCLSLNPELNAMGMRAHFEKSSVMPAFIVALIFIILKTCCGHQAHARRFASSSKEVKEEDNVAAPVFQGSG